MSIQVEGNRATYDTIKLRLDKVGINIEKHIKQLRKGELYMSMRVAELKGSEKQLPRNVKAHDRTLEGIEFTAIDPMKLKSAFYGAKDSNGKNVFASVKSNPDNLALKCSLIVTDGIGWREVWEPVPYKNVLPEDNVIFPSAIPTQSLSVEIPVDFTSLHCSIDGDICKIHIDEAGFVLRVRNNVSLGPNLFPHTVLELGVETHLKPFIRDILVDFLLPDGAVEDLVKLLVTKTSLAFPNASNNFMGLEKGLKSVGQIEIEKSPLGVGKAAWGFGKAAWRVGGPRGVTMGHEFSGVAKVEVGYLWSNNSMLYITIGGNL